jgi:trehalose 6-phosphate synthase
MSSHSSIIVASNRGPIRSDSAKYASGGLVQALMPSLINVAEQFSGTVDSKDVIWFSSNTSGLKDEESKSKLSGVTLWPVTVDEEIYKDAYGFISNRFLWFLHHGLFKFYPEPTYDDKFHSAWENFRTFNLLFAENIIDAATEDSLVLIQDYHLSLVPNLLKKARPDLKISHFSHIPFGTKEDFKNIPVSVACELLTGINPEGTLAGFHTALWENRFIEVYKSFIKIPPNTFSLGLGVDAKGLIETKNSKSFKDIQNQIDTGETALLVRSDRLEPSKNIINGFLGFDKFLKDHPEFVDKIIFKAFIYPSRTEVKEYCELSQRVQEVVKTINLNYQTSKYLPIDLIIQNDRLTSLAALSIANIVMVNSFSDGMNLVVKEAVVVNEKDCSIILSHNTGAYHEFKDFVIGIDPEDIANTAEAIYLALVQPKTVRKHNLETLKQLCKINTAETWFNKLVELTSNQK